MISVLHANPAGAEAFGHVHGEAVGMRADDKAEAIVAIDRGRGGCRAQHFDFRPGIDAAQSEHVEITVETSDAVGVDAAQIGSGKDFGGLSGVVFGNAEMEKHLVAEIAQRFDGEKFGLHFGHVPFAFLGLRRKGLPASFSAKWYEEQANRKSDGRQRDGNSEGSKVLNARADEKGDCGAAKSGKRSGKSEGAGAALGWILFGEPERVDGKIRAAKTKKEKTNKEPGQRRRAEIENLSEGERDESRHQRKEKSQSAAPPEFLRERGHSQATENGGKRNEHGGA